MLHMFSLNIKQFIGVANNSATSCWKTKLTCHCKSTPHRQQPLPVSQKPAQEQFGEHNTHPQ